MTALNKVAIDPLNLFCRRHKFGGNIRLFVVLSAVVLLLLFSGCGETDAPTGVVFRGNLIRGELTGTLTLDNSPYLADSAITVPAGEELVIQPGVELRFEPGVPFEVYGKITARGTESAPIKFTSGLLYPERGDWDGIWLIDAAEGSRFEYCYFLYGAKYGRRYNYRTVAGQLDSTLWEYGSVTCVRSSPTISRCWFLAGGFHGLYCDAGSNPVVERSIFYDNAGHGIFVHSEADPDLHYNIITENGDYGLFCWEEGNSPRSALEFIYNIVWSNFSGEFSIMAPPRLGRIVQTNSNLDSVDFHFNLRLNPDFKNAAGWDFRLNSCSAAIDAGPEDYWIIDDDGTRIELGIYPYHYRPGEIRRLLTVDRLEAANSPYYMTCDLFLPAGNSLTVEGGVEVLVQDRYRFRAQGLLLSQGTAAAPIYFRSGKSNPDKGDWIGIILEASDQQDNEFSYTTVANARYGIYLQQRDAVIDHCTIMDNDSVGIYCDDASAPIITDSEITNNEFAGILCKYNSSPQVIRCNISGGAGYGVYAVERSMPVLTNNIIYDISTTGIRLENRSDAIVINNTVALNGYYGIYCENNSSPVIRNNIFYRNGSELRGGNGVIARAMSRPIIEYNSFWDHALSSVLVSSSSALSESNIEEDPLFVDYASGNFRLQPASPCLEEGDPEIDPQMGAFGGPGAGE